MIGDLHPTVPLALLAGLLSFLSPCVFPLVPVYAAFLGGRAGQPPAVVAGSGGAAAVRATPSRVPLVANGLSFVAGFSAVFVLLFYVLQALEVTLFVQHQRTVSLVAGVVVVVLALQTLGLFRFPFLLQERRLHLTPRRAGIIPSFVLGLTFAAGWTPCIGPQLGAILQLAQNEHSFGGLPFMLVYCAGLAIPFLVVALLADRLQGTIRRVNRHLGVVNAVAGALLLVFGLLLILDRFTFFSTLSPQSPFDV